MKSIVMVTVTAGELGDLELNTKRAYCEDPGDIGIRVRKERVGTIVLCASCCCERDEQVSTSHVGKGVYPVGFPMSAITCRMSKFSEGNLGIPVWLLRHIFFKSRPKFTSVGILGLNTTEH